MSVFLIVPRNDRYIAYRPGYLGIASLVGALGAKQVPVSVFDLNYETVERLEEKIIQEKPAFIGLTVWLTNVRNAYALIERLIVFREKTGIDFKIVCGGPHPTVVPGEAIGHGADLVIRGEAEEALSALVLTGKPRELEGAVWGNRYGAGGSCGTHATCKNLEALSLPDRTYYTKYAPMARFSDLATSRGCVGRCSFCATDFSKKLRFHSLDAVFEEMRLLHHDFGVDDFLIFDDSFCTAKKRFLEFCSRKESDKTLSAVRWRCFLRLDEVEKDLVAAAKSAGCYSMIVGVEFLDPTTQLKTKKYRRPYSVAEITTILKVISDAGVGLQTNFLFGFPWETRETYSGLSDFLDRYGTMFYFIGGYVICPAPGTELYNEFHREYGFTDWWLASSVDVYRGRDPFFYQLGNYADAPAFNYFKYDKKHLAMIKKILYQIDRVNSRSRGFRKSFVTAAGGISRGLYYKSARLENRFFSEALKQYLTKKF